MGNLLLDQHCKQFLSLPLLHHTSMLLSWTNQRFFSLNEKYRFYIVSTLLKLRWNYAETSEYVWFLHSFRPEISRFGTFLQCGMLVPNTSFQFPFTETCCNLANPNSFSMQNLFGNLAYVQFPQLKHF